MDVEDLEEFNFTQQDLMWYFNSVRNHSSYASKLEDLSKLTIREAIIIASYSIIVVVSIFGNLLVCNIVARRASMRRTTYVFIANLALSDLLMTVLNIPFNVARVLLNDWPFGSFMCSFMPLVQATSVYVSTFTMMFIALDRYRVICKPLMPRLSPAQALKAILLIWVLSIVLSFPHAVFNEVQTVYTYQRLVRCRHAYPSNLSQWITLTTFSTQFVVPLSVTGISYFFIVSRIWSRDILGVVTEAQMVSQAKAKRKTIVMLLVVVIIFALCWLPLNVLHLVYEFMSLEFTYKSLTVYFICHWLAMSSVCYNPFIYCWLNQNFRSGAITCFVCIRNVGRKLNSSFRSTREFRLTDIRCDLASQSCDSTMMDSFGQQQQPYQGSKNVVCCCKKTNNNKQPEKFDSSVSLRSMEMRKRNAVTKQQSLAKCSGNSVNVFAENRRQNGYYSVPEIKLELDSNHPPKIRKCFSWSS